MRDETDKPEVRRLAVLIDAENVSAGIAQWLFQEVGKIGDACVRRIYGDFSNGLLQSWQDAIKTYAIATHQNFSFVHGKNSSDIALVIDAMDLLHSGQFDGFCLVSSDSDFTGLAMRIREQCIHVYGFGESKTPESLQNACHAFTLVKSPLPQKETPAPPVRPIQPALKTVQLAKPAQQVQKTPCAAQPKKVVKDVVPLLRKAMSEKGWISLSALGKRLREIDPAFSAKAYGSATLGNLIRNTKVAEVQIPAKGTAQARLMPPAIKNV